MRFLPQAEARNLQSPGQDEYLDFQSVSGNTRRIHTVHSARVWYLKQLSK